MAIAQSWWRLALVCAVFAGAAAVLGWKGALFGARPVLRAALRATVQLAAVSSVVAVVLLSVPLSWLFLAVMATVATATAATRTGTGWRGAWVAVAVLGGTAPAMAVLLGSSLLPMRGTTLVPVGGILLGGAMTASTLAVRRVLDALEQRRGEFEAALALGFTEPEAVRELVRRAAADALLPALDQTRTVGLVTLPGAFVGMVLGGAPAWQAGALQLVVLLGLLLVESIAIVAVVELVAHGLVRRPREMV
ncbi:ABC transporter permease [Gandjariella thermophila]|uniref:ABC transporter permease n=1 Tax=Gandjariella thermophila TaxID=1931992 RepID=A0A4D4J602_9PSEU|nr:ABC transporter permease [Gandjariella thermophila]GDY30168.1 ABC transporter permease [Gandjariella thermophila]